MKFFRDFLDGPIYIIAVILSVILIMAIIGFLMERKKLEKEAKERITYVDNPDTSPIEPVNVQVENTSIETSNSDINFEPLNNANNNEEIPASNEQDNPGTVVETPVIVFKEPETKE